jgi:hypothetical protein
MTPYTIAISLHVVIAVLGVGQIGAVALGTTVSRRSGVALPVATTWLRPLLRCTRWSLVAMFVTGASMELIGHGTFHESWWFRGSALLLFLTLFLNRRAFAALGDATRGLQRVERLGWWMSANMAVAAVLMEVKPF